MWLENGDMEIVNHSARKSTDMATCVQIKIEYRKQTVIPYYCTVVSLLWHKKPQIYKH